MKSINEMNFEEAIGELEKLVSDLDSGNVPLEKSVALYERGAELKAHCEARLKDAEMKIQEIALGAGGTISSKSADELLG